MVTPLAFRGNQNSWNEFTDIYSDNEIPLERKRESSALIRNVSVSAVGAISDRVCVSCTRTLWYRRLWTEIISFDIVYIPFIWRTMGIWNCAHCGITMWHKMKQWCVLMLYTYTIYRNCGQQITRLGNYGRVLRWYDVHSPTNYKLCERMLLYFANWANYYGFGRWTEYSTNYS